MQLVHAHKTDPTLSTQRMLADEVPYLLNELAKCQSELSLNAYQGRAEDTRIYPRDFALDYCAMKLASEAGEVAGKMAKRMRDDGGKLTETRRQALKKELGDVLWYVAMLAFELDFSLDRVARDNLEELASRAKRGVLKGDGDNR